MEGNKCEICYLTDLNKNNTIIIDCGHKLCNKCYKQLIKKECPFCRYRFGKEEDKEKEENILNGLFINYYFLNIPPIIVVNNEDKEEDDLNMDDYIDVQYFENRFLKDCRVFKRLKKRNKKKKIKI